MWVSSWDWEVGTERSVARGGVRDGRRPRQTRTGHARTRAAPPQSPVWREGVAVGRPSTAPQHTPATETEARWHELLETSRPDPPKTEEELPSRLSEAWEGPRQETTRGFRGAHRWWWSPLPRLCVRAPGPRHVNAPDRPRGQSRAERSLPVAAPAPAPGSGRGQLSAHGHRGPRLCRSHGCFVWKAQHLG